MSTTLETIGNKPSERLCENWIDEYLSIYSSGQESPEIFHLWTAFSLLASTIGRKVVLQQGYLSQHPNLYVVLVAASGRLRKSSAMDIGARLFSEAFPDYPLIAERITLENLISTMHATTRELDASLCYIHSDEFHTLIGRTKQDASLVSHLTKFYDCPAKSGARTQLRGFEECRNVCVNLLATTTPLWLREALPPNIIGGGFTSRINFIYAETTDRSFPFPEYPEGFEESKAKLLHDIEIISKLEGTMQYAPDAKAWFKKWYKGYDMPDTCEPVLTGYYGRRHTYVSKLGTLLSLARNDELIIEKNDLLLANSLLNDQEKWLPKVIMMLQTSVVGEANTMIMNMIGRMGRLEHSDLLRKVSYKIGAQELVVVLDTLRQSRQIDMTEVNGKIYYMPYGAGKK